MRIGAGSELGLQFEKRLPEPRLVPEPRLARPGRPWMGESRCCLEIVSLKIVNCPLQCLRRRKFTVQRLRKQRSRGGNAQSRDSNCRATRPGDGLVVPGRKAIDLCGKCIFRRRSQVDRASPPREICLFGDIFRIILDQRTVGALQKFGTGQQYTSLERRIVGYTKRPAQFESDPKRPWRAYDFRVFAYQADARRRDTLPFEEMSERADGARAGRSNRHKQSRVDAVLLQQTRKMLGVRFGSIGRKRAHEGVMN